MCESASCGFLAILPPWLAYVMNQYKLLWAQLLMNTALWCTAATQTCIKEPYYLIRVQPGCGPDIKRTKWSGLSTLVGQESSYDDAVLLRPVYDGTLTLCYSHKNKEDRFQVAVWLVIRIPSCFKSLQARSWTFTDFMWSFYFPGWNRYNYKL